MKSITTKDNILLWILMLFLIVVLPDVLGACEGLSYGQCNGACKPDGNFYTVYRGNQYTDCYPEPECSLGDITISSSYFENRECCENLAAGCPPYSTYTGNEWVSCLNNYVCISNCTTGLNVCEINGQQQCINLQTDNNNCGSCGNQCASGETCENGACNAMYTPFCPNGRIDPPQEQCDDGNYNDNDACTYNFEGTQHCQNAYCGDAIIWNTQGGTEQCDGSNLNGASCADVGLFSGTVICNECQLSYDECYAQCGNGHCESSAGENQGNCLADCTLYGWHTTQIGWIKNEENRLVGMATTEGITIYSDPFDVRVGRNYTLNATIINSCPGVVVDLNDGKCLSRNGWTEQTCFTDQELYATGHITFLLNANVNHISQGFLRNVSVRIYVPPGCTAKFDDITFEEVSPSNPYHLGQPTINLTTACCPKEYCWDGSQCILSDAWNISNTLNLWDTLTKIDEQPYKHVNTSLQWLAKGYRCVLNDSGYANWEPAEIKYDWDYAQSGYCIRDTDCFVAHPSIYVNPENGGSSCIKNGQFINEYYEINKGNHYCMNGSWTTKTFLIANVLENISNGKPYIIFCDDTGRIFNNLDNTQTSQNGNGISGGCVLILKESNAERVITGFYVEDPFENDMMEQWWVANCNMLNPGETCEVPESFPHSIDGCTPLTKEFRGCWHQGPAESQKFVLYLNNNSYYYLFSDKTIPAIEEDLLYTIWNNIVRFFQRLFGYTPSQPLGLTRQTQNYEKLYVLSNNTLKVSAVEEKKYDEELVKKMVYIYLNVTGQDIDSQNNNFNIEFINKSVQGVYYTFEESSNNRILVMKYNNPSQLWPYLTAMLRDRP